MTDYHKFVGTGQLIGTIDLADIGTLAVYDDGDADPCVTVVIEDENGQPGTVSGVMTSHRAERGDEWLETTLGRLTLDHSVEETTDTYTRPTRFICDECGLTTPGSWNATPDEDRDVCRPCVE